MNGKKAKMLRRNAEKMTVGHPALNYVAENIRKYSNGVQTGTLRLGICTRRIYKQLKKNYKAA